MSHLTQVQCLLGPTEFASTLYTKLSTEFVDKTKADKQLKVL